MQKLLATASRFTGLKLKGARLFFSVLGLAMVITPASNIDQIKAKKLTINDMPSQFFEASLDRNSIQFSKDTVEAKIAYPEGKMAAIPEAGESGTPKPVPSPTPTPVVTPKPEAKVEVASYTESTSNFDVVQYIIKYAQEYEVNVEMMIKIAECESGYNENAVNGPFAGIYQFLASTWTSNRNAMGLDPNPDLRFNAEEAARTAAFKMSRDGFGAWPACSQKAMREI